MDWTSRSEGHPQAWVRLTFPMRDELGPSSPRGPLEPLSRDRVSFFPSSFVPPSFPGSFSLFSFFLSVPHSGRNGCLQTVKILIFETAKNKLSEHVSKRYLPPVGTSRMTQVVLGRWERRNNREGERTIKHWNNSAKSDCRCPTQEWAGILVSYRVVKKKKKTWGTLLSWSESIYNLSTFYKLASNVTVSELWSKELLRLGNQTTWSSLTRDGARTSSHFFSYRQVLGKFP